MTVCDTKVLYDSEFEAEIAASKMGYKTGDDFLFYQCNRHWHIAHKDRQKRHGVGKGYYKCWNCQGIFKKADKLKHHC